METLECPVTENRNKVTSLLMKRENERQLEIQKRRTEKKLVSAEHEHYNYFTESFQKKLKEIEELIDSATTTEQIVAIHLNKISKEIQLLQKFVAESILFLRGYDIRICQQNLLEIETRAKKLEEKLLPKKKFGFKSKRSPRKVEEKKGNGQDEVDKCQIKFQKLNENDIENGHNEKKSLKNEDENATVNKQAIKNGINEEKSMENGGNATENKSDEKNTKNGINEEKSGENEGNTKENKNDEKNTAEDKHNEETVTKKNKFDDDFFGFKSHKNETLELLADCLDKKDVTLQYLEKCIVKLPGTPSTIHMSSLNNCLVLVGPVTTSVFVENCKNCKLVLACQQLRLHSSTGCDVYLHVTSKAIIEDSKNIKVAPYNYFYDTLENDFKKAGLDREINHWDSLDDFNWLVVDKHSPNWSILDETSRETNWDNYSLE